MFTSPRRHFLLRCKLHMDWGLCFLTCISSCIPGICIKQEGNILKCRLSKSHKSWPGYSVHLRDKLHPLPIPYTHPSSRDKLVSSLFLSHSECLFFWRGSLCLSFPSLLSLSLYLFLSISSPRTVTLIPSQYPLNKLYTQALSTWHICLPHSGTCQGHSCHKS